MNVTQRNYTINRINALLMNKVQALLAENDVLVKAHNDDYTITFDEFQKVYADHPEVIVTKQDNNTYCGVYVYIDDTLVRTLLGKPTCYLQSSTKSYVNGASKQDQQLIPINGCNTAVLNATAERIKKLQQRASFAKDQVMLGDAKEALQALEEFNSLIF